VFLVPLALWKNERWPPRSDWPAVIGLALLFYGFLPALFNASLIYTTAARAALAISTTPLIAMVMASLLGIEPMTTRKTIGLALTMAGVGVALTASLSGSPIGAWRGDALMLAAASCMALSAIWSRPLIMRSGPFAFAAAGMMIGTVCLIPISFALGGLSAVSSFGPKQWMAALYLAVVCGAVLYFLWSFALGTVPPTIVALTITVNPITAAIFGALFLGEPIRLSLAVGLVGVAAGIWIAAGLKVAVFGSRRPGSRQDPGD